MFTIDEIANRIRTQDNRCTADPFFLVQERVRIYGIDKDYDPQICWLYEDESVEVHDPEILAQLEKDYLDTGNDTPEGYRKVGYVEEWRYVTACFTEAAAEHFIRKNSHRHRGELRVYAETLYRNHEMILIREFLLGRAGEPTT